jgi:hypothetical protein
VQVQDPVTTARNLLNDPASVGRYSNTQLISWLNDAVQEMVRDCEFPVSRLYTQTIANQQEYATPELILAPQRVYLAGQLLPRTSIDLLEGKQTQDFDQGLSGGYDAVTPVQTPGSGGPPGTVGMYSPTWNVTAPQTFPIANAQGAPAPGVGIYQYGQRPVYYWRGGSIGIVPAPAGVYDLVVEGVRVPSSYVNLTDAMTLPSNYRAGLAWKIVEYASFSNDGDRAGQQFVAATQKYEAVVRKLRSDRKQFEGDYQNGPKLFTYRRKYTKGNNKGGGWGYCE